MANYLPYAGIGSRETPEHVKHVFSNIASILARRGFTLRSGGADGADQAFEYGCDFAYGQKEIFLPWKGFNSSSSNLIVNSQQAFDLAKHFHPAWDRLSAGAKKLQARNSHQVLGWDLNSPSKFVICWTVNGAMKGGTAQAIRMAQTYNIPVINAGLGLDYDTIILKIKEVLS